MDKNQIKKYLNFLNIKEFYPMKYKKCEICGSLKTKLIKKKNFLE